MDEGPDLYTLADVEAADTFRTAELMTTEAEHIDLHRFYIDRNLTEGLNSIGMKKNAMLVGNPSDLRHRLDGTDLIIGKHDTDQDRIRPDRRFKLIQL